MPVPSALVGAAIGSRAANVRPAGTHTWRVRVGRVAPQLDGAVVGLEGEPAVPPEGVQVVERPPAEGVGFGRLDRLGAGRDAEGVELDDVAAAAAAAAICRRGVPGSCR